MADSQGSVYTEIANGIGVVEFGHPAGNSLPRNLLDRLESEFERLSQKEEVKLIILRSEGEKAFCAGASFDELLAVEDMEQGKNFFSGFARVINAMRRCEKLIIGRIHGKTVGGGVGLAAACDYCFASVEASIKLSELSIGIGPFVIAPAVKRKINVSGLSELSLAAHEWKNAYWAQEKGLYARVFDKKEDLDKELFLFAERLAKYNPSALREMKTILWEGTEHWDQLLFERAEISGRLVLSSFTEEELKKFKKQ